MIKKAQIKSPSGLPAPGVMANTLMQMAKPKVLGVQKAKVKEPFNFDSCLKKLQKPFSEEFGCHEDFIVEQESTMKKLISTLENKVVGKYILEKFKNSRFKSFKMATRTFVNMIEGYFEGSVDIKDITSYQEGLPNSAGEHWYEEFNDFRINFINGIRNKDREKSFAKCIQILVEAETAKDVDTENDGYVKFLENNMKLNKTYTIDLMEMNWPEKGGTLKLLFGNN